MEIIPKKAGEGEGVLNSEIRTPRLTFLGIILKRLLTDLELSGVRSLLKQSSRLLASEKRVLLLSKTALKLRARRVLSISHQRP